MTTERQREYQAAWARVRSQANREAIAAIKLERGCKDCGYNEHSCALDFDHRDPAKKLFDVSRSMTKPLAKLLEEIEKCDVRCAICHRVRSYENRWMNHVPKPPPIPQPQKPKKEKPKGPGKAQGTRCAAAKLTEDQVKEIRRLGRLVVPKVGRRKPDELSWAKLGRMFSISEVQARNIALGNSWKHVKD